MCIRDSLKSFIQWNFRRAERKSTRFGDILEKQEKTKQTLSSYVSALNSCLLYTSDAADERSSVDLGGRRIIKKKNNTYIVHPEKTKQKKWDSRSQNSDEDKMNRMIAEYTTERTE